MALPYVKRKLQQYITDTLFDGQIIILYGARQTGKTSMIKRIVEDTRQAYQWWNADEPDTAELLTAKSSAMLQSMFGEHKLIVIDEAQRIKNIGLTLKLIVDNFPHYQVIATGSSSFDLSNDVNEPLTGRKWEYVMPPFAVEELINHYGVLSEMRTLGHRLVYGMYPGVALKTQRVKPTLKSLMHSYLYKDVLAYEGIRHSSKLNTLLKALALQVGAKISYAEIGQIVELDTKTVEKYIDILEKSFVVFRLHSYSRNLRTELKKSKKIYFWDNGIRNAAIGDFSPIENRTDTGQLWENFVVSERYKYILNNALESDLYFWRTHLQQELDLVEITPQGMQTYEIKWNPKKSPVLSKSFARAYPEASFQVINRENYLNFVTGLRF